MRIHILHRWTYQYIGSTWRLGECRKCKIRKVECSHKNGYPGFPQWWLDGLDSPPVARVPRSN